MSVIACAPQNKTKLILKEKKYANILFEGAISGMQKRERKEMKQRRENQSSRVFHCTG